MSTTPTFIYLIEAANGLVKIGVAQKVRDRFQATRLHSPVLTRLIACWPGSQVDEHALHERFRSYREHGEWFVLRGEFAAFVERSRGVGVDHIPTWGDLKFNNRPAYVLRRNLERTKARPKYAGAVACETKVGITPQQRRVLDYISGYLAEHGCAPSYQEIGDSIGVLSKSGVHRLVHGLVSRGHLSLSPGRGRTITLSEQPAASVANGVAA
ncbi:hypothetical protein HNR01_001745 [Methylorubrum rhodesianum]|jgi:hypothetical protein|uniref:LexA family protein n=1 Tax=Methylorubrum rhodesianum TaxID=29427 RepID=UPI00161ED844|nr:GIY-YIG nuclease family protein [Methylorubrum rhodesianum]MBB5762125.1 hypothetical protein [Methylorubrum rhodesianum]